MKTLFSKYCMVFPYLGVARLRLLTRCPGSVGLRRPCFDRDKASSCGATSRGGISECTHVSVVPVNQHLWLNYQKKRNAVRCLTRIASLNLEGFVPPLYARHGSVPNGNAFSIRFESRACTRQEKLRHKLRNFLNEARRTTDKCFQ